jgi:hypothetical protein
MSGIELDHDHDEFLREIIRRMEATTLGSTFRTARGSTPLTSQERDHLDLIAARHGLTAEKLVEQYVDHRSKPK